MIIKELTLHNFGVYAGTNRFMFQGERPIVLIGGMNGRGKTTFLEGVLLALYGPNSFAYTESNYKTFGQYLKAYVNRNDGTLKSYVSLEFTIGPEPGETYRVMRSWSGDKIRTAEQIQVWKNGKEDEFLTENWPLYIESLMPSGLSNFFFFDGEKIAELAVEETSEQMKDSIKTLLGISVIDSLQSDLQRVVSRIEKQQTATANSEQIDKLRVERDEAAKKLAEAEEELADLKKQREKTIQKIESKREEYSAKGGDIYTHRQQLYSKRTGITSRIEALSERLVTDAASELPLLLVRHLLEKIKQKAESEHEQKLLGSTLAKLENLFTEYDNADLMDRAAIQRFIDYVRSTAEPGTGHVFAELSDSSVSKLQVLLDSQLDANRNDVLQRKLELAELQAQMDQLDNYLSVEIDEEAINQIYRKIKELEQEQIALDVKIQGKEEECRTLNGKSMAAASAFKRNLEEYIRKAEFNDDGERVLKYAHMASTILSEYTNRLQQRKVAAVADTMTECYKQLANKTSLIHHIEMDPTTLDLKYIGPDGKEVDRASLSAGEKQLMVISLLWALGRCSKKKLPVIIDTPLSRLDSAHRSSVIQTYFPQASDQTIILSTDTEIDQSYYELMRPNIGDEFTLIYNDETKSTTISSGYFPGV